MFAETDTIDSFASHCLPMKKEVAKVASEDGDIAPVHFIFESAATSHVTPRADM